MEATPPFEDPSFRVAPASEASHDTDTPSMNVPRQPGELSSLLRGRGRLRPPLLPVPSRAGDMAVGKCGRPWDHIDRGVLGLPVGGFFRREADWRCIFAVLWAIWTHRNDVIFRGANPSGDAIRYAVRGFVTLWFRGGLGPSSLLP